MEENRCGHSSMDHEQRKIKCSSRNYTRKGKGRECCMCGDVGFQECLFRCHRCHHRFQHIYCSRLYSDQLELDGVNVCDWCLDFQEKQKIQSRERKVELQEMESRKAKKVVACSEIVSTSAMKKPRKANSKPGSLSKLRVRLGGSKQNQQSNLPEDCELSSDQSCRNVPPTSTQENTTKGRLSRRYKLLSDVLCS